jgi:Lon protease-like protein
MQPPSLALFPLHTVLFPGGPLALRIFEPRYLDLVRRCLKQQAPFGVVLIREGVEAGAVATIAPIGTTARLVDFDALPGGLLGVSCLGERRFRVLRRWQQQDGLNLAEVEYLPEDAPQALPAGHTHLAELLRKVLPQLGAAYAGLPEHYEDAGWVSNRWAEILALGSERRLELLMVDDPLARLEYVAALSERQAPAAGV